MAASFQGVHEIENCNHKTITPNKESSEQLSSEPGVPVYESLFGIWSSNCAFWDMGKPGRSLGKSSENDEGAACVDL